MRTQQIPCVDSIIGQQSSAAMSETLILLMDLSASMRGKDWSPSRLHGAKAACLALLERKQTLRPHDRVGIATFSNSGDVKQKPTSIKTDRTTLDNTVQSLKASGGTEMAEGLRVAGKLLGSVVPKDAFRANPFAWLLAPFVTRENDLPVPQSRGGGRRIILLTDGHNTGWPSPVRVAEQLKSSGIAIDCIGIGGNPREVDEKELKAIASTNANGKPRYWFIGQPAELVETFQALATSIRGVA